MIGFLQAAVKALQRNDKYDYYQEYENLYIFSIKDAPPAFGGFDAPALIDKNTGEFTNHMQLINENHGEWLEQLIREGDIQDRFSEERPTSPMHGARYALEHRIIPKYLYENGIGFMGAIADKEANLLNKVLLDLLSEDGVVNPYGEDPIKVEPFRVEDIIIARIIFPEPEEDPLCYESYAFFNSKDERAAYYCLEKGQPGEEPFLCGWSEDGIHLNFNNCSMDRDELLVNMLRLFLDPTGEETPPLTATFTPKDNKVENLITDPSNQTS